MAVFRQLDKVLARGVCLADFAQDFARGVEHEGQRGSYSFQEILKGRVSGCVFVGCGSGSASLPLGIGTQTRRVVEKVRVESLSGVRRV